MEIARKFDPGRLIENDNFSSQELAKILLIPSCIYSYYSLEKGVFSNNFFWNPRADYKEPDQNPFFKNFDFSCDKRNIKLKKKVDEAILICKILGRPKGEWENLSTQIVNLKNPLFFKKKILAALVQLLGGVTGFLNALRTAVEAYENSTTLNLLDCYQLLLYGSIVTDLSTIGDIEKINGFKGGLANFIFTAIAREIEIQMEKAQRLKTPQHLLKKIPDILEIQDEPEDPNLADARSFAIDEDLLEPATINQQIQISAMQEEVSPIKKEVVKTLAIDEIRIIIANDIRKTCRENIDKTVNYTFPPL